MKIHSGLTALLLFGTTLNAQEPGKTAPAVLQEAPLETPPKLEGRWYHYGSFTMGSGIKEERFALDFKPGGNLTVHWLENPGGASKRTLPGTWKEAAGRVTVQYTFEKATQATEWTADWRDGLLIKKSETGFGTPMVEYNYYGKGLPSLEAPEIAAKAAEVLASLKKHATFTGTMHCDVVTRESGPMRQTSPEWEINLELRNATAARFASGNQFLAAQLQEDGWPGGSYIRDVGSHWLPASIPRARKPYSGYAVEHGYDNSDGRRLYAVSREYRPMLMQGANGTMSGAGFPDVPAGGRLAYVERMNPGQSLKTASIASLIIAPPALIARCDGEVVQFRALVTMRKKSESGDRSEWEIKSSEWFMATPDGLGGLLDATRGGFIQIMATNWLVQARGAEAFPALQAIVADKKSGATLAGTLALAAMERSPIFEAQAVALEKETTSPGGIAILAGDYLDAIGVNRGFATLGNLSKAPGAPASLGPGQSLGQLFKTPSAGKLVAITLAGGAAVDEAQITVYETTPKGEISNNFTGKAAGKNGRFVFEDVAVKGGTVYALVLQIPEGRETKELTIETRAASATLPGHMVLPNGQPQQAQKWKPAATKEALALSIDVRPAPASAKPAVKRKK